MEITSSNFATYISFGEHQKLGRHIKRKHINEKSWLSALIESQDPEHFPYRLSKKKYGRLENRTAAPKSQNLSLPSCRGKRPLYLINMPFVPPQSRDYASFNNTVNKIRDESFGKTAKFSKKIVKRRTALVVGMNRYKSLDEAENRRFRKYIRELPKKNDLPLRVIGKLWLPVWTRESKDINIYCPWKCFKLLKVLKPRLADKVKRTYEKSSPYLRKQIPYQAIRNWILHSRATAKLASHMLNQGKGRPVYLKVSDDDTVTLRGGGKGALSIYDNIVMDAPAAPRLLTTGYCLKKDEKPLLRLGVALDMAVREATASVIPLGPYFPEPNLLFLLNDKNLDEFSFEGNLNALESRRLIDSNRDYFTLGPVIFKAGSSFITATPGRMKTKYNQTIESLDKTTLGQKKNLQALRGISQSHAMPRQWANNIYAALPLKVSRVTDITKEMMAIFKVFDPISLSYCLFPEYDKSHFDEMLENYDFYIELLTKALKKKSDTLASQRSFAKLFPSNKKEKVHLETFFSAQVKTMRKSFRNLRKLGLEKGWRFKVIKSAKLSGKAMRNILSSN